MNSNKEKVKSYNDLNALIQGVSWSSGSSWYPVQSRDDKVNNWRILLLKGAMSRAGSPVVHVMQWPLDRWFCVPRLWPPRRKRLKVKTGSQEVRGTLVNWNFEQRKVNVMNGRVSRRLCHLIGGVITGVFTFLHRNSCQTCCWIAFGWFAISFYMRCLPMVGAHPATCLGDSSLIGVDNVDTDDLQCCNHQGQCYGYNKRSVEAMLGTTLLNSLPKVKKPIPFSTLRSKR